MLGPVHQRHLIHNLLDLPHVPLPLRCLQQLRRVRVRRLGCFNQPRLGLRTVRALALALA